MIDTIVDTLEIIPRGLVFVGLGLIILVIAKLARDIITPYKIDDEVTNKNNLAVAVRLSGYFIGVILVFLGTLYQPLALAEVDGLGFNQEYAEDVLRVFLYSLAGIAAQTPPCRRSKNMCKYRAASPKILQKRQGMGISSSEKQAPCSCPTGPQASNSILECPTRCNRHP